MNAIYEPKGPALEYAPLACNLFRGCTHGCKYCYCPGQLRMKREDFHAEAVPRRDRNEGILTALARDARRLADAGDTRRVHLCFTCDPVVGTEYFTLLGAMDILREHRRPVSLLTKAAIPGAFLSAWQGMDLEVGVSLVWGSDALRQEWEPGAATVATRLLNLRVAKALGFRTFASVEPVVDPDEGLAAIDALMRAGCDEIRVGRLNHMDTPHPVDWRSFAVEVKTRLVAWASEKPGRTWMLKRGLSELVDSATWTQTPWGR